MGDGVNDVSYSVIGILASILLLIINQDIFLYHDGQILTKTQRNYRWFLMGVLAYLVTDLLWGLLYSHHLIAILYTDTSIHFAAMVGAVMLWTQYVVSYLDSGSRFERVLLVAGRVFFALELVFIAANFFMPVLFWFDENGVYQAGIARYVTLGIQIFMFLITSVYTLFVASKSKGRIRLRHMTIGFFGIAMMTLITVQVFYPLLPLYAMGCMLGTSLLHSFVVEDEKDEYRRELEEAAKRDREQKLELAESREAMKEALAVAENANKAKTSFLSNMSHEIRTPMNAIIGLNNIAMNDPTASKQVKEYLSKIGASAQHLMGIINEILDMSRIESGRMTIKKEEFSFAKALEQVNTIISDQCNDKGIAYDCQMIGRIDEYYIGDVMKIKQVMINILGNAVKFTPKGGTIRFLIEEGKRFDRNAVLKFIISDTGIGMSEEFLPHIFDPFSQEDSSTTSKYGSTGLGMPITKSIVELMNGHIDVTSKKGKGTTFTVTLTLGESDRKQQINETGLVPRNMSVLVIDDDSIALEHAEIVLSQVGISCETAESGWEGIDKVRIRHGRGEDYNLFIIDWKMPEMDGIETTRQIRKILGNETPVIILSAFNGDEIADEAREAGVDTFVSKPLFASTVMDEFAEAFRSKKEALEKRTINLKGRRVLLAEDVAVNAEIVKMVLAMREIEVDLADNGLAAVNLFESHESGYYDAILMDMRMPEMDGLEATRVIRSLQRDDAKTIPIIALTANAFDEDVQRSMQAGLNSHLSKPVEPEALFEALENLIRE